MLAIYKRELKAHLGHPRGCLLIAAMLIFCGLMVFIENLNQGHSDIKYALLMIEYVLLILIPVLCMRSMSDDRRQGTDLLYASLPLSAASVVLGKYLALVTVYAIPCAVLCVYPPILGAMGPVDYLNAYILLFVFFLLGAALIAVCQFLSALTDRWFIALPLGVAALVLLYVLPFIGNVLPETALASFIGFWVLVVLVTAVAYVVTRHVVVTAAIGVSLSVALTVCYVLWSERFVGVFSAVLNFVSPFLHFQEIVGYGILDLSALTLLLSYPVFFVFLTIRSADKKRWA